MARRHGDLLGDGSVEALALDAVHGDGRSAQLEMELRLLARSLGVDGARVVTAGMARESARRSIARQKVAPTSRPERYLAAERRPAGAAMRALDRGDRAEAFRQKQRQLLAHHLWRESRGLQQRLEAGGRGLERLRQRTGGDLPGLLELMRRVPPEARRDASSGAGSDAAGHAGTQTDAGLTGNVWLDGVRRWRGRHPRSADATVHSPQEGVLRQGGSLPMVATLDVDDQPAAAADLEAVLDWARRFYRRTLQQRTLQSSGLGGVTVRFSRLGLEKLGTQEEDDAVHVSRLRMVPAIRALVENGALVDTSDNRGPERKPRALRYHRLAGVVSLAGRKYEASILIEERRDGQFYYVLENPSPTVTFPQRSRPGSTAATFPQSGVPSREGGASARQVIPGNAAEPLSDSLGLGAKEINLTARLLDEGMITGNPPAPDSALGFGRETVVLDQQWRPYRSDQRSGTDDTAPATTLGHPSG